MPRVLEVCIPKIRDFWFHDLRHTFASWYMMNGGDLNELAKILGHAKHQDDRTLREVGARAYHQASNTAKVIWNMLDKKPEQEEVEQQSIA